MMNPHTNWKKNEVILPIGVGVKNIAVFASGRGSNFSAIYRAVKKGKVKARLALLICDNPQAPVLAKAKRAGVKIGLVLRKDFATRQEFEKKIISLLEAEKIEFIALAGFMRILGNELVQRYSNRIINIHPALLPAFKGGHGIKDAFTYGVKITGVTVHFVDGEMDHGAIILQRPLKIEEGDTLETLEAKVHKLEHKLYPEALNLLLESNLKIEGRSVRRLTL